MGRTTSGIGGPKSGDHQEPHWYIQYGMDLGAVAGTVVRAAFEGHVTKFKKHTPSSATSAGAACGESTFGCTGFGKASQ